MVIYYRIFHLEKIIVFILKKWDIRIRYSLGVLNSLTFCIKWIQMTFAKLLLHIKGDMMAHSIGKIENVRLMN